MVFRTEVEPQDRERVREIVTSTGFFHPYEIDIAIELVDERLAKGEASGYHFLFAEENGRTVGYTAFGPIACTQASYDLFWIVVHGDCRGKGVGKMLMARSEEIMRKMGALRVYIETSSREIYFPTRAFYLACDYRQETILEDFYGPGDDKVIFVKALNRRA
jgi:GNAT superfamily N-acetyltransferase